MIFRGIIVFLVFVSLSLVEEIVGERRNCWVKRSASLSLSSSSSSLLISCDNEVRDFGELDAAVGG